MRAFQGQASDNVAIKRTTQQKQLLIRELEETLSTSKVSSLRAQLSARISALKTEIREDKVREEERAAMTAARSAVRRAPREQRDFRASRNGDLDRAS